MKRREAREIIIKSLYHMTFNHVGAEQAIQTIFVDGHDDDEVRSIDTSDLSQLEFITNLVKGVYDEREQLDAQISTYLTGWKMDRLSKVDLQILRLALYELSSGDDTPAKVIVNEAIELAKHFGTEQSGKFVNGVLGRVLKESGEPI